MLQHLANQIEAYTWTGSLNIRHAELAVLTSDGRFDERGFFAAWTLDLTESVFEFPVCLRQRVEEEIDRRPGIVLAFMPALRTLFEDLVRRAHLRPIVVVALQTEMRQGETAGLKWEHVDFESEDDLRRPHKRPNDRGEFA